jgi:hypothetical protein
MIMNQGDDVFVKFPYQAGKIDPNSKRDFIFVSKGYYLKK